MHVYSLATIVSAAPAASANGIIVSHFIFFPFLEYSHRHLTDIVQLPRSRCVVFPDGLRRTGNRELCAFINVQYVHICVTTYIAISMVKSPATQCDGTCVYK